MNFFSILNVSKIEIKPAETLNTSFENHYTVIKLTDTQGHLIEISVFSKNLEMLQKAFASFKEV